MGKTIVKIIGLWFVIKSILNIALEFNLWNVLGLFFCVIVMYLFNLKVPYSNYIVAIILVFAAGKNFWHNITNFQIIYLTEAVIDILCACLLMANKSVREYFAKL